METAKSRWHSAGWWAAVGGIAAVLGVVVAVVAYVRPSGATDGTPVGGGTSSSTPVSSPTTSSETTSVTAASAPSVIGEDGETSTSGSDSTRYYLAELDYVDVELEGRSAGCTGGCAGFEKGAAKIGATNYPQSFITRMDGDGGRSVSTWNALRSCDSFEASLGLTNDSDSTSATFTISKDGGSPEVLDVVATGDVAPVTVNMSGVSRFTLAAYVSGAETEHAEAVWGDAVLTCTAGSLD